MTTFTDTQGNTWAPHPSGMDDAASVRLGRIPHPRKDYEYFDANGQDEHEQVQLVPEDLDRFNKYRVQRAEEALAEHTARQPGTWHFTDTDGRKWWPAASEYDDKASVRLLSGWWGAFFRPTGKAQGRSIRPQDMPAFRAYFNARTTR